MGGRRGLLNGVSSLARAGRAGSGRLGGRRARTASRSSGARRARRSGSARSSLGSVSRGLGGSRGSSRGVLGRVEDGIHGSIVDHLTRASGGRTSRRDDGFIGREPREQARGSLLVLGVILVLEDRLLLGKVGRALEKQSEEDGSSERPVQPVSSSVDSKQVHDPPHGDLGTEVGMARVGEQTVGQKSEAIVALEVLLGISKTVLFVLEGPLLLISGSLDAEERDEGNDEQKIDRGKRSDSGLAVRSISGRSDEEEQGELEEADEGDVEQDPQRSVVNRPDQNLPAVVFVSGVVTTLTPEVVGQTESPGQA